MKKLILLLALATLTLSSTGFAQQQGEKTKPDRVKSRDQKSYELLVDQYATASLGYMVEQRCRQLAVVAYEDFQKSQDLLDGFMLILMGGDDFVNLVEGLKKTALDVNANPCNVDTFKFALATAQISSSLATRVQLLGEEELIKLNKALHRQMKQAQESGQLPPPEDQQATPVQPVETVPEPEPQSTEPAKTEFETLTPTYVDRQPEPKTSSTPPVSAATQQPVQAQAQPGTLLANYVNPYPYSAPPAPAGETEKDMKRRQRQEIIDLRRAQRAEMDAFKDNKDSYADPDAVEGAIKDRQDAEFDAMRNRHQQELGRF